MRYRNIQLLSMESGDDWLRHWHLAREVVQYMRQRDWDEVRSVLYANKRGDLLGHYDAIRSIATCFRVVCYGPGSKPVALMGVWETSPHVGSTGMIATPDFGVIALDLARYVRRVMIPACKDAGLHRVEARAMTAIPENCRWLEVLGATKECNLPLYGKNGETFSQYAFYGGDHVRL